MSVLKKDSIFSLRSPLWQDPVAMMILIIVPHAWDPRQGQGIR